MSGDSLLIADRGLQRYTVLAPSGVVVRTVPYPTRVTAARVDVIGVLPDGDVVLRQVAGGVLTTGVRGVVRDTLTYYRYSAGAPAVHRIVRLPGLEQVVVWEGSKRTVSTRALAKDGVATLAGDLLVYGQNDQAGLQLLSMTGAVQRSLKHLKDAQAISRGDRARHRREVLEGFEAHPALRAAVGEALADEYFPATLPPYRKLLTDSHGQIWAADYVLPWNPVTRWTVFTAAGNVRGVVDVPSRLDLRDIGADHVLGVWSGEFDTQEVRMYGLRPQ